MMIYTIFFYLFISYISLVKSDPDIEFGTLTQNNTGPLDRELPVWLCYPGFPNPYAPKCFLAAGYQSDAQDFPSIFYNEVWRMDIDLLTFTVNWTKLPFDETLVSAGGAFPQFWRKNFTAFSWTASLFAFDKNAFSGNCRSDQIFTYDFHNLRWEITTVVNSPWQNITDSACGQIGKKVYCFGGFNCSHITTDLKIWTEYDIDTNTYTVLNSDGLSDIAARSEMTVSCISQGEGTCLIGHGNKVTGGTVDTYVSFDVNTNTLENITVENDETKKKNLEFRVGENWRLITNDCDQEDYMVLQSTNILVIGGGIARGVIGPGETTRIIGTLEAESGDNYSFDNLSLTGGLFPIEDQQLSNIPRLKNYDAFFFDSHPQFRDCDLFVEYGGGSDENSDSGDGFPNVPVLYIVC